jgi:hypothetical protein
MITVRVFVVLLPKAPLASVICPLVGATVIEAGRFKAGQVGVAAVLASCATVMVLAAAPETIMVPVPDARSAEELR